MWQEFLALSSDTLSLAVGIAVIFSLYVGISGLCYMAFSLVSQFRPQHADFTSRKTVTFGDESAVTANRFASVLAVITIFLIWGVFTGSKIVPLHVPGPFSGNTSFTYTAENTNGETATATVHVQVKDADTPAQNFNLDTAQGFAHDDQLIVPVSRSKLLKAQKNDLGGDLQGYKITQVNHQLISPGATLKVDHGHVRMTAKGSLSFTPNPGWQMEAIWLPAPEAVLEKIITIAAEGYQNVSLAQNVGWSMTRVVIGFLLGCLFGIPLGFAMGLNGWLRGWFDPIVEFMRPVPPLALIPLVIIWFGIWEQGKISLLFLASLWIMTIAARAGVSGVNITKVHAAYSLGASKRQVLSKVILPNSLPEIFTGARVAMGVCWGTVVAAELVAAEKGAGKMIIAASKFQQTDIVIMGIVIIGIIGYSIEILMRKAEDRLVPWKGKS